MGRYASVYFSPEGSALEHVIGFIDRCTQTLDCAIYSLTHDDIAGALIRAHERGVKVRVLMDKTQAGSQYADDEKLEAAGIEVRRDRITGVMHHKFAIGDEETPGRAVGTGSFNWTANAAYRNMENWNVMRLSYIVRDYSQEFLRLWELNAPV